MADGIELTVGDGTNPGGLIVRCPTNYEYYHQPVSATTGGEIDFGAEGVLWATAADQLTYVDFGNTKLTSTGSMTFAGRAGSEKWKTVFRPKKENVNWKGATFIEGGTPEKSVYSNLVISD